ncbi:MAG: sigma-70 family RNA polymerase sigma factor [Pseudomonadota bacterium]
MTAAAMPTAGDSASLAPMGAQAEQLETCRTFLAEHAALLYRVAASYEADPSRREDLLQDIALALWQATPSFRGDSSFRTFALRVAHNRCATHGAREKRRRLVEQPEAQVPAAAAAAGSESLVAQEALLAAVRELPIGQRQVVALAFEGLSYEEIATVLDLTVSNVGVRLNRARKRLTELLHG